MSSPQRRRGDRSRPSGEGELVGLSWLLPPYRWAYDARAHRARRAPIALDAACLRGKCEDDHDLGYELMKRFVPVLVRAPAGARGCRCSMSTASPRERAADRPDVAAPVACGTRRETADTWTLELEPPTGRTPGPSRPGQFNMLYAFGVGEVPISISGDRARRRRAGAHGPRGRRRVERAGAGCKRGDVGRRARARSAPPGRSSEAAGSDVVIVAGGLGLRAAAPGDLPRSSPSRERYGKLVLLYGTRSPEEILYRRELETWRRAARRRPRGHRRSRRRRLARPRRRGDEADPARAVRSGRTRVAMVCGPE